MATSVQFYGIENAVELYRNNRVPAWGLFSGKQLLFKYAGEDIAEGAELLSEILEKINSSNATYTLKVFEQDGKDFKIKENTPCDCSFNFKLVGEDVYEERNNRRFGRQNSNVLALEERIAELESDKTNEDDSVIGKITKTFFEEPEKFAMQIGAIQTLFNLFTGKQQTAGSLGAIPGEGDQIINQAIDILKKNDPKIGEHLLKLASISENDKTTWAMLIGMIDKM